MKVMCVKRKDDKSKGPNNYFEKYKSNNTKCLLIEQPHYWEGY